MTLSTQISFGDIFVILGLLGSVIYNYAVYSFTLREIRRDIDDLKRGRGYIMGPTSDWPDLVRRCFGYGKFRING